MSMMMKNVIMLCIGNDSDTTADAPTHNIKASENSKDDICSRDRGQEENDRIVVTILEVEYFFENFGIVGLAKNSAIKPT